MAINREEFLKVFDETIQDPSLLASYKEDAKVFLSKLQNNTFPLYGLIGEYGTGKSTFLNAVKYFDEQESDKQYSKNIRITFEARKYPDRKELWDAFIIEILSQVITSAIATGKETDVFEEMENIKEEMLSGQYNSSDKTQSKRDKLKQSVGATLNHLGDASISASSAQKEGTPEMGVTLYGGILAKFLGSCIASDITQSKQSVSRIFDYEYFFAQYWIRIIQKYSEQFNKVYIIIEDIDRCGTDGLVFLETLSYFMNTVSRLGYNMDKMTCIVSIGQGFLNDNRHLINKAITSYELFSMKTESIKVYFSDQFNKSELGLTDIQRSSLNEFITLYLDKCGPMTRSIREIKYLFKKIVPEMVERKSKLKSIADDIVLGMTLFNFSCFIRSNKKMLEGTRSLPQEEVFDTKKGLYFCRLQDSTGSIYIHYLDTTITSLSGIPGYSIGVLKTYSSLFGMSTLNNGDCSKFCRDINENNKGLFIGEVSNQKSMFVQSYWLLNE